MTAIEIPHELAEQLKLRAQQLHIPFEQLVVSVLQKSLYPKHGCFLTPEQFAFTQTHHQEIEQAHINFERAQISGDDTLYVAAHMVVERITSSENYRRLFGNMEWDSLLDNYESTPGYDNRFRISLRHQLNTDIASGALKRAPRKSIKSGTLSPEVLKRLKQMRKEDED